MLILLPSFVCFESLQSLFFFSVHFLQLSSMLVFPTAATFSDSLHTLQYNAISSACWLARKLYPASHIFAHSIQCQSLRPSQLSTWAYPCTNPCTYDMSLSQDCQFSCLLILLLYCYCLCLPLAFTFYLLTPMGPFSLCTVLFAVLTIVFSLVFLAFPSELFLRRLYTLVCDPCCRFIFYLFFLKIPQVSLCPWFSLNIFVLTESFYY